MPSPDVLRKRLEALRQQLHAEMLGAYDPARMQALLPLTQEIDRLTLTLQRQCLDNPGSGEMKAKSA